MPNPPETMKRLPIPQREFGFVRDTFRLMRETAVDGDRLALEREQLAAAKAASDAAQIGLFNKRRKPSRKGGRHD